MASKDWNNMLSGRLYHAQDSELAAARLRARRLVFRYNQSAPENESLRRELARELFGQMGEGCYLEPPLRCDYGKPLEKDSSTEERSSPSTPGIRRATASITTTEAMAPFVRI